MIRRTSFVMDTAGNEDFDAGQTNPAIETQCSRATRRTVLGCRGPARIERAETRSDRQPVRRPDGPRMVAS